MEPALRKRMFRHPAWMRIMQHVRELNADSRKRSAEFIQSGHVVSLLVVKSYSGYPATVNYYIDGVRMTPAVFGDELNRILDLEARGVATLPVRHAPERKAHEPDA